MKPGKFKVFAGITPYLDGVFLIAYANHHPGCLFCVLFCASVPLLKKAHLAVVLFSFFSAFSLWIRASSMLRTKADGSPDVVMISSSFALVIPT